MITAYAGIAHTWWIPESQKDEPTETQTAFKLRGLTGPETLEVYAHLTTNDDGDSILSPTGIVKAARFGLVDWRNVGDLDGEDVPFSRRAFDHLPSDVISPMALQVLQASNLDAAEAKN